MLINNFKSSWLVIILGDEIKELVEDDTKDNSKTTNPEKPNKNNRNDVAYYMFLVFFTLFIVCSFVTAKVTYMFFSKYSLSEFKDLF